MNLITQDESCIPTQEGFIVDEFLMFGGEGINSIDIGFCIVLLSLDFSQKVHELGVFSNETPLRDLFSTQDEVNWSTLETSWANILRNTRKNILQLVSQKEKLILKPLVDITREDEENFEELDEKILTEILIARDGIEQTFQEALNSLKIPIGKNT